MNNHLGPYNKVHSVTPSDTVNFTTLVKYLYVGTSVAGTVTIVNNDNTTATFINVPAGSTLGPFLIKRVNATGTTATNILAFA